MIPLYFLKWWSIYKYWKEGKKKSNLKKDVSYFLGDTHPCLLLSFFRFFLKQQKITMKFTAIASGIILAASSVAAQLTAPMQNYNVSSPVSNEPYVVGQILPCTIRLFENVMSGTAISVTFITYKYSSV